MKITFEIEVNTEALAGYYEELTALDDELITLLATADTQMNAVRDGKLTRKLADIVSRSQGAINRASAGDDIAAQLNQLVRQAAIAGMNDVTHQVINAIQKRFDAFQRRVNLAALRVNFSETKLNVARQTLSKTAFAGQLADIQSAARDTGKNLMSDAWIKSLDLMTKTPDEIAAEVVAAIKLAGGIPSSAAPDAAPVAG